MLCVSFIFWFVHDIDVYGYGGCLCVMRTRGAGRSAFVDAAHPGTTFVRNLTLHLLYISFSHG